MALKLRASTVSHMHPRPISSPLATAIFVSPVPRPRFSERIAYEDKVFTVTAGISQNKGTMADNFAFLLCDKIFAFVKEALHPNQASL